ncbi:MAG: hypothetical protein L0215_07935, partial [Gemmataceae bacterium]|nr:hypothetical protein [Gemmataceae bacterium]
EPSYTAIFIVDKEGVRKATLPDLAYAHAAEFPVSSDEKDHRKIIESIVFIHSAQADGVPARIISSTADIPGYKSENRFGRALDRDLEDVIRPSWKEERPKAGYLFYVVYSYNQMGGAVGRYKFQFNATARDDDGRFHQWRLYTAEHILLGTGIGDARWRK